MFKQIPSEIITNLLTEQGLNEKRDEQPNDFGVWTKLEDAFYDAQDNKCVGIVTNNCRKSFIKHLVSKCEFLRYLLNNFEEDFKTYEAWKKYTPRAGVIILGAKKRYVLLIKSFRLNYWNFAKGRIEGKGADYLIRLAIQKVKQTQGFEIEPEGPDDNYDEVFGLAAQEEVEQSDGHETKPKKSQCDEVFRLSAEKEVFEELGLSTKLETGYVHGNPEGEPYYRLFIIEDLDMKTSFQPQATCGEVQEVAWVKISNLESSSIDKHIEKKNLAVIRFFIAKLRQEGFISQEEEEATTDPYQSSDIFVERQYFEPNMEKLASDESENWRKWRKSLPNRSNQFWTSTSGGSSSSGSNNQWRKQHGESSSKGSGSGHFRESQESKDKKEKTIKKSPNHGHQNREVQETNMGGWTEVKKKPNQFWTSKSGARWPSSSNQFWTSKSGGSSSSGSNNQWRKQHGESSSKGSGSSHFRESQESKGKEEKTIKKSPNHGHQNREVQETNMGGWTEVKKKNKK